MTTKSESIPGCIFYPYIDRTTTYNGGAGLEVGMDQLPITRAMPLIAIKYPRMMETI